MGEQARGFATPPALSLRARNRGCLVKRVSKRQMLATKVASGHPLLWWRDPGTVFWSTKQSKDCRFDTKMTSQRLFGAQMWCGGDARSASRGSSGCLAETLGGGAPGGRPRCLLVQAVGKKEGSALRGSSPFRAFCGARPTAWWRAALRASRATAAPGRCRRWCGSPPPRRRPCGRRRGRRPRARCR